MRIEEHMSDCFETLVLAEIVDKGEFCVAAMVNNMGPALWKLQTKQDASGELSVVYVSVHGIVKKILKHSIGSGHEVEEFTLRAHDFEDEGEAMHI